MTLNSYTEFEALISEVQACRQCPEMEGCTRVLSWANGPHDADLMFVGEAPGRLGADRTAIPFHGDKSGDNFEKLLDLAGLARREVFITNAVLCNPRDEKGNNSAPSKSVLRACAENLRKQIEVVNPKVVATLGSAALEATRLIEKHDLALSTHVRKALDWNGRKLVPLYHPGARAMIHRNFAAQTADYYFVGETYRRAGKKRSPARPMARPNSPSWDLVRLLLASMGECSLFRLHKAMFLIDWKSLEGTGARATDFVYVRQKDGPYCVELGSRWFHRFGDSLTIKKQVDNTRLLWNDPPLFEPLPRMNDGTLEIAGRVLSEIAPLSDGQLKTRVYLSAPMKAALQAERQGSSALNRPLI